jgi:hypothetical protein
MTNLIDDAVKAKDTLINYGIIVAVIAAIGAAGYGIYVTKRLNTLSANYQKLETEKQIKQAQIEAQEKIIETHKKAASEKDILVAAKDEQIAKLNKEVDNLQKTKYIEMAKDAEEVKEKIYAMYSDKEVEFTKENKYLFTASTTYNLIYDAESWRTNGLILTTNNNTLFKSNIALREGLDLKSSLVLDLKKIQADQDLLIISLKDKDKISDQQIKNLQETLVLTDHKTVYKIIGSFLVGAATYYIIDKTRKH